VKTEVEITAISGSFSTFFEIEGKITVISTDPSQEIVFRDLAKKTSSISIFDGLDGK